MKLSEGVEQAIHCVTFLTGLSPDGFISAASLAELFGVSTSYLLKHLQALSRAGILEATLGPKGGYRLARSAAGVSLLDIVVAIEGASPAFRCAEIRKRGPNPLPARYFSRPCEINAAMLRAEQAYRTELAKVSIADIAAAVMAGDDGAIAARGCAFLQLNERKTGNRASS